MTVPTVVSTASEAVVRRISKVLGNATWSRRSFLVRTTLFGSALVVDPKGFAIEGRSAYDSVCGTDAGCDGGFTAFCCTIQHGANLCPEGTFVGGWWKADRSAFCRGEARYYVDCNGKAGWPWRCHCPETASCDHRHVACVRFRYGNCNLDLAEHDYGSPVVCRVVTCTPPWVWDPACTQTSFTDDFTVSHSAPCLPGPWSSRIIIKWSDLGGPGGPLGPQASAIMRLPDGNGTWARFRWGAIFDVSWGSIQVVDRPVWDAVKLKVGLDGIGVPLGAQAAVLEGDGWSQPFGRRRAAGIEQDAVAVGCRALGTHLVEQPILARWTALGREGGVLGYPTHSTHDTRDGTSTFGTFAKQDHGKVVSRGAIYANPVLGVHAVRRAIFEKWHSLGSEAGPLGYPSTDEAPAGFPGAAFNDFAVVADRTIASRGAIYTTSQYGTCAVMGNVYEKWTSLGARRGALGFPTSDALATRDGAGTYATFRPLPPRAADPGGAIVSTSTEGTWALLHPFFTIWIDDEAGPRVLGVPAADEVGYEVGAVALRSQAFATGTVYDSDVGRGCILYGPILTDYEQAGGPTGSLGLPTSSVETLSNGDEQATFQFGTLTYVPGQGVSAT